MNWTNILSKAVKPVSNRARIVLWSCLAALLFGIAHAGGPIEDNLRDLRAGASPRKVSGDIALIAIDNKSLSEIGRFPWPRERYAELINSLAERGAKRIYFNILFDSKSDPHNDAALAAAIAKLGHKVVLPAVVSEDAITGERTEAMALPEFRRHADMAHATVEYGWLGTVRNIPESEIFGGKRIPSLASKIAGGISTNGQSPIDFSMTPGSVPVVSAIDVINGRADPELIQGKDVIIGVTYTPLSDAYVAPVHNRIPSVYFHILAAETLRDGPPRHISWLLAFLPALVVVIVCSAARRRLISLLLLPLSGAAYLVVPIFLERKLIYLESVPALFLLSLVGGAFSWTALRRLYRERGTTNVISGLPNLTALYQRKPGRLHTLVAARVHNYAEIASTLSAEAERELVEQITNRLLIAAVEPTVYQGDEGIFSWFAEQMASSAAGVHLDALHRLFRSPVIVGGKQFDLKITFGFDVDVDRSLANRLASSLVAADEAEAEGIRWKEYDPAHLKDADWRLSLLSQLDAAIDSGDLWVAYQPKLDLRTSQIVGAEALARWTHPTKGPISPIEFILAAEENDRIEKLTFFVLEHAVRAAAAINRQTMGFSIAVNLSARLIGESNLVSTVMEVLRRHSLPPQKLTLEVTETAALASSGTHLATLQELRDRGVEISVDDYGTGMSTLEYLQRIPSTEIKIDRSFVAGMTSNQATKVMVNSTIQLVHSLGKKVVAEGVEDDETLDELRRMSCDIAQGYLIGRPMTFQALTKSLMGRRGQNKA